MKIAINGFGRIGRVIVRINSNYTKFKITNINDLVPSAENMAYLFKYDSTYGKFDGKLSVNKNYISINSNKILYSSFSNIEKIPFEDQVDVLIDSSGDSRNIAIAKNLIKSKKIKKYIFTMSSNLVDEEIIYGINEKDIKKTSKIFSSSICDANAISHILNVIENSFGILSGTVITLHPWLTYQNLLDGAAKGISPDPNKYTPAMENNSHLIGNYALGRSSVSSLIPKETTAVLATDKILKSIKSKLFSLSYRVPTSTVASATIFLNLNKEANKKTIIEKFKKLSKKGLVKLNNESLTSKDYEKEMASAIIDLNHLTVLKKQIQVIVWYDNEWGYSARVLDLAKYISK